MCLRVVSYALRYRLLCGQAKGPGGKKRLTFEEVGWESEGTKKMGGMARGQESGYMTFCLVLIPNTDN